MKLEQSMLIECQRLFDTKSDVGLLIVFTKLRGSTSVYLFDGNSLPRDKWRSISSHLEHECDQFPFGMTALLVFDSH